MRELLKEKEKIYQEKQEIAQREFELEKEAFKRLIANGNYELFSVNWKRVERQYR